MLNEDERIANLESEVGIEPSSNLVSRDAQLRKFLADASKQEGTRCSLHAGSLGASAITASLVRLQASDKDIANHEGPSSAQ